MLEVINQFTVANDVRMRRTAFKGSFVLVEGRSDQKLYVKFVDAAQTQVLVCRTRDEVIHAIQILNADLFQGALGILDADFDRIEAKPPAHDNMFFTDGHDAEMMMLNSVEAFKSLMSEFGSPDKHRAWAKTSAPPLLNHLCVEAAKVGALLLYSLREKEGLDFGSFKNGLKFNDFTSEPSLVIDTDLLIKQVLNKSRRQHAPVEPIQAAVDSILANNYPIIDLARGHDLIDVLCFALRKVVGSCDQIEASGQNLESHLRVAYSADSFKQTQLFQKISVWAKAKGHYQFF